MSQPSQPAATVGVNGTSRISSFHESVRLAWPGCVGFARLSRLFTDPAEPRLSLAFFLVSPAGFQEGDLPIRLIGRNIVVPSLSRLSGLLAFLFLAAATDQPVENPA